MLLCSQQHQALPATLGVAVLGCIINISTAGVADGYCLYGCVQHLWHPLLCVNGTHAIAALGPQALCSTRLGGKQQQLARISVPEADDLFAWLSSTTFATNFARHVGLPQTATLP